MSGPVFSRSSLSGRRANGPGLERRLVVFVPWVVSGLMCVVSGFAGQTAFAKDRPPLPKHVAWVVDDQDPKLIAAALSLDRSANTGAQHQGAIHAVVVNPSLMEPVLAAVTDTKRRSVARSEIDAALQLRRLTKAQPQLPSWKIQPPAPVKELRAAYDAAQAETGVGWQYLAAVVTYAQNMESDPMLLEDYHAWNVIYRWVEGDVALQQGYGS